MKELKVKESFITTLCLMFLLLPHQSLADKKEQTNSNIDNFTYPNHTCNNKPIKPVKPAKFASSEDVETYNNEISKYNIDVATYNKNIKSYKSCINKYIKKSFV